MNIIRMKQLVDEVLKSLSKPHTEDVIEEVFQAIEANPVWRKTYDACVRQLGKGVANGWAGFWVAHAEQRLAQAQSPATRTSLLDSYAKLAEPEPKRGKKVKEPEALQLMRAHFEATRDALPASIREQRELIVTLIMDGIPPEAAFSKALEKPAFAR
jgi:hypothetical protein